MLPNYCASPVGRTFPSAAGVATSELFFTDDDGTYFFPTRDFHPQIDLTTYEHPNLMSFKEKG